MVNQKECYSYFFLSFLFFLEIFFYSIRDIKTVHRGTKNYDLVMIKKIFYLSFSVTFFYL